MIQHLRSPKSVTLKKTSETLCIVWGDDDRVEISGAELRRYCACASCRSRQLVGSLLINETTTMTRINLMGKQALQIVFADGHDRGIYPWDYLHAIARGRAMEYLDSASGVAEC